jgi:hypothetical protein
MSLSKNSGWVWGTEDIAIISETPRVLKIQNGQLHCDNGPAIQYSDGWSLWFLNGVAVPQWLVETKTEDIDPKEILKISNAEQRREFIRKVGIDRICYTLKAEVIDKKGEMYELLLLDYGDGTKRPYLKMQNPSLGVWHVEGVPVGTKTVEEAIISRKPPKMREIPVSKDGEDWGQQGDVVYWPKNAKCLKPRPNILT